MIERWTAEAPNVISRIAFFQAAQVVQGRTDNRKQSYD